MSSAATTVAPTTTTPPGEPAALATAINAERRELFGFAIGDLDPAVVLDRVRPTLGEPTRDTGWYTTPHLGSQDNPDCLGDQQQRVLRWGNVAFVFWGPSEANPISKPMLWTWTVGDAAASLREDRREPDPIVAEPVWDIGSADGLRLGMTLSDLKARYGTDPNFSSVNDEPASRETPTVAVVGGNGTMLGFAINNGQVTGIGASLSFC